MPELENAPHEMSKQNKPFEGNYSTISHFIILFFTNMYSRYLQ